MCDENYIASATNNYNRAALLVVRGEEIKSLKVNPVLNFYLQTIVESLP